MVRRRRQNRAHHAHRLAEQAALLWNLFWAQIGHSEPPGTSLSRC